MFYDIKKLNELEKELSENLMQADGKTWEKEFRPFWVNYRGDIPKCLMVIREYRSLLEQLDPRNIHIDQRKQDTRRDAWDRDYMPANWTKPDKKTDKRIENAKPVFIFAFFYICIIVMMSSVK